MSKLVRDAEPRESHTIDIIDGRLRKNLVVKEDPAEVITTVRGQGYLFELR